MTSKHTSGQWERIDTADYAEIHSNGQRQKSAIALVGTPGDADLIAAAPDLLEVLKEATLALDGIAKGEGVFKPIEQTIKLASAAIAKAEGRS